MCLLFESIKVENNKFCNLNYHNQRFNRTILELLGEKVEWDLDKLVPIPENLDPKTVYKCRILYRNKIESVEFLPYIIRDIKSFGVVYNNLIEYSYKRINRNLLDGIRNESPMTDDVIIIKNNLVTDSSHANLVFFDGHSWITPDSPLLCGTKRQQYIDENIIQAERISMNDIKKFIKIRIINAMIDLKDSPEVPIENVFNLP